jgi:hypothetical protein
LGNKVIVDLTPDQIASVAPAYWATLKVIKLQSGPFSTLNHEYQIEPLNSKARRVCYRKATQGGFSEIEVLKTLHGMIYGKYPQGALYMFPTTDDVNEFSKARFNPLIMSNKAAIGKYVKSTDTASLKKINDAFLYLRGARLSHKVGPNSDVDESSKMRGIPVDVVKFDEEDLMDEEVKEKARGRMGHSQVKEEVYISNPTIPGYGIDKTFANSDQRYWFRRCGCGTWTCAEKSFPNCVKIRPNGTGYIGCDKCGKELPLWAGEGSGEWVADYPSKSDFMHGYHWSQLTSTFNDPAEILDNFINPQEGNLGDVYRLRLGLPYVAAEDKLQVSDVLQCCGQEVMGNSSNGPCAMGVDVGKIKHVVIGTRTGNDRYQILKVAQVSAWEDIHDLARKFNVKSGVIDIRPYEDEARRFQKAEPYRIFLCEYGENTLQGVIYNDVHKIVKANRTEIFDASHNVISQKRVVIPRDCPDIKEFAKQLCNTAKVLETNKKTGTSIYRYKKLGSEHYRNALNYFLLAASGSKVAKVSSTGSYNSKPEYADNSYERVA